MYLTDNEPGANEHLADEHSVAVRSRDPSSAGLTSEPLLFSVSCWLHSGYVHGLHVHSFPFV